MGHGFAITDERFEELWASVDSDGSGTVDFEEFLRMLGALKKEQEQHHHHRQQQHHHGEAEHHGGDSASWETRNADRHRHDREVQDCKDRADSKDHAESFQRKHSFLKKKKTAAELAAAAEEAAAAAEAAAAVAEAAAARAAQLERFEQLWASVGVRGEADGMGGGKEDEAGGKEGEAGGATVTRSEGDCGGTTEVTVDYGGFVALLAAARAMQEASLGQRQAEAAERQAKAAAEAAAAEEHKPERQRNQRKLAEQGGMGAGSAVDQKMKVVFDKYDANGSGNIDKQEMKLAVQTLGFAIADARCGRCHCGVPGLLSCSFVDARCAPRFDKIFSGTDVDGSGEVDFGEFLGMLSVIKSEAMGVSGQLSSDAALLMRGAEDAEKAKASRARHEAERARKEQQHLQQEKAKAVHDAVSTVRR
jgi:Ca2+-binding EF-hand superfamily protein